MRSAGRAEQKVTAESTNEMSFLDPGASSPCIQARVKLEPWDNPEAYREKRQLRGLKENESAKKCK